MCGVDSFDGNNKWYNVNIQPMWRAAWVKMWLARSCRCCDSDISVHGEPNFQVANAATLNGLQLRIRYQAGDLGPRRPGMPLVVKSAIRPASAHPPSDRLRWNPFMSKTGCPWISHPQRWPLMACPRQGLCVSLILRNLGVPHVGQNSSMSLMVKEPSDFFKFELWSPCLLPCNGIGGVYVSATPNRNAVCGCVASSPPTETNDEIVVPETASLVVYGLPFPHHTRSALQSRNAPPIGYGIRWTGTQLNSMTN